ncbi:MAG: hypothetical protein K1564_04680 [Candidatus Thiodiazotropha sp. (ex. Lucinisca nassula)]|nr:hypothetical protein [Candidatus Thiodiazotropha sp. (ex. Lucinisca nassula)]
MFIAQSPNGEEFTTAVEFSMPYETEKLGWFCNLRMKGIQEPQYAAGTDSLQALMLTLSLAEATLLGCSKKGWQFFWPDTNEPMKIEEMFSLESFVSTKK